jgi:hypothetical protein
MRIRRNAARLIGEGKDFFFEKKKQKTLAISPLPAIRYGGKHTHRKV